MNSINNKTHNIRFSQMIALFICMVVLLCSVFYGTFFILPAEQIYAADSYLVGDFPADYKALLAKIHERYPNYIFQADYTDSDFYDVLDIQNSDHRRLVSMNPVWGDGISWRAMNEINYDWNTDTWINTAGNWTDASYEVIAYYMDPRNFLTVDNIYSFMQQSYDQSSRDRIKNTLINIVKGTFFASTYSYDKKDPDDSKYKGSYVDVLMDAGEQSGVSPIVLAGILLQEQGSGDSALISGKYKGYEGYYNFFNFGANGKSETDVIVNGLKYAKSQNWNTRYASIVGGALKYADGYINNGQDTYYYKDYNVVMKDYDHQYAQSVYGHKTSANWLNKAFSSDPSLSLYFKIPVFDNMPSSPCERPAENSSMNNYYFRAIKLDSLSPAFDMYTFDYSASVNGNSVITLVTPTKASYIGPLSFELKKGTNKIELTVEAESGYTRTYTISVNASKACTMSVSQLIRGDANGDGKISSQDYIAIKNHIMDTKRILDDYCLNAADANADGKISSQDYIAIKNHIMGTKPLDN